MMAKVFVQLDGKCLSAFLIASLNDCEWKPAEAGGHLLNSRPASRERGIAAREARRSLASHDTGVSLSF